MTRALHPFAASFLILLALAAPPLHGAPRYTVTHLGIGGSGYQQIRMNDNGQFLSANGISTADGENTPVGFQPINLNNLGQVVGVQPIYNGTIQPYHAQLWTNGNITDLGPSAAFGINDQGDVVGSIFGDPIPSPFIWTPSGGQQPLDGVGSAAVINNARQIAGPYGYWASPSAPRQSIELDAVYDINSAGQVAGSGPFGGGIFTPGAGVTWLGGFENESTHAYGINDHGQVVGGAFFDLDSDFGRAFYWTAQDGLLDLNSLIDDPNHEWFLQSARDVNNSGLIVGLGRRGADDLVPFLLTPIPEPGFCLVALAIGICGSRRRR